MQDFLNSSGICKFGADCSYAHPHPQPVTSSLQMDIDDLKASIHSFKHGLAHKEHMIQELQEKVKVMENKPGDKSKNSCETCSFKASSLTVLKSHMTNKHNENQKETFDSGISLSPPSPTPSSPCDLPTIECDYNVFNETCNICGKTFHTKQDFVNHNFDSHLHCINDKTCRLNDCSNIANNYFK